MIVPSHAVVLMYNHVFTMVTGANIQFFNCVGTAKWCNVRLIHDVGDILPPNMQNVKT